MFHISLVLVSIISFLFYNHSDIVILFNAKIYTIQFIGDIADTLIFSKKTGKIIHVGGSYDYNIYKFPFAKKLDMKQKLIVPGLIDSHAHLMLKGSSMSYVSLRNCTSLKNVNDTLYEFMQSKSFAGSWLIGDGWDQNQIVESKEFPTRFDLDDPRLNIPILLYRIDLHAVWMNTLAFKQIEPFIFNVSSSSDFIKDQNGILTGIFLDDAIEYAQRAIPKPSEQSRYLALKNVMKECLKYGITSVHDAGCSLDELSFFKRYLKYKS
jgi:predicted amidohydrolase YtcJ